MARIAHFVLGAATLALTVACGATPDATSKNDGRVTGSPNDPGWTPPGNNGAPSADDTNAQPGDDSTEQPTGGPSCTWPATPVPMDGWTTWARHHFTVNALSKLHVGTGWDDGASLDASKPDRFAELDLFVKYAIGSGWVMEVSEDSIAGTAADALAAMKAELEAGTSSTCTATFETKTLGCDPAAVRTIRCTNGQNVLTSFASTTKVFHAGETFTLQCTASAIPADTTPTEAEAEATCATFVSSFAIME